MSLLDFIQPVPPDVAIEIDAVHVAVARLARHGSSSAVAAHVVEALPPGVVVPGLAAANITDVATVTRVIQQAVARLGGRVTRAALVIPDTAAKVSLIRFDKVPPNTADLVELVRWQVRKSAPFPLDQAVISFTPGIRPADGGQEFVVTTARVDVIEQYEQACTQAGVHAGLIDIATFSILNGVLAADAAPAGDWLLVHATPTYTTLAVLRGGELIFFRNREEESGGTLADVVHQTAMYYEDRLAGAGFSRVLLAGGAVQGVDAVRRSLEQRLDVRIEAVAHPDLASLAGILSRERKVA
jgi:Tfp pilus assembly PilM family ATPase